MENRRDLIGKTVLHLPILPNPAKNKRQNVFHSLHLLLIFIKTFCLQAGGEIPSLNHAKKLFTTIFFPPADFLLIVKFKLYRKQINLEKEVLK